MYNSTNEAMHVSDLRSCCVWFRFFR